MPDLLPQHTSGWSNWLGIIGLDLRPYRWWLVGDRQERRGEFTVDHLVRGGDLTIGTSRYRMKRRQSGLRETTFTLMAASGQPLASGARRVRGLMTRETALEVRGQTFVLSGTGHRLSLLDAGRRSVGSLEIERMGWTVRQSLGRLRFDKAFSEPEQVFLFWLALYRDLVRAEGD
jgi:hypothetical protein